MRVLGVLQGRLHTRSVAIKSNTCIGYFKSYDGLWTVRGARRGGYPVNTYQELVYVLSLIRIAVRARLGPPLPALRARVSVGLR
jgi:hypothetical protein